MGLGEKGARPRVGYNRGNKDKPWGKPFAWNDDQLILLVGKDAPIR
jgi:hypothetical protein